MTKLIFATVLFAFFFQEADRCSNPADDKHACDCMKNISCKRVQPERPSCKNYCKMDNCDCRPPCAT
jgi:hypothetical protein